MRLAPDTPQKLADFGELIEPAEAAEPILSRAVRDALSEWLCEIRSEEDLAWAFLKPRKKALFDGPPGGGKTTLAIHLAARLKLRMLIIRPDRIIDRWIGWRTRNMGDLFNMVAGEKEPLVLFFDEFDALAGKRRGAITGGDDEHNGSVNTLLQRMEAYPGYMIAATNFGEQIDEAIWRRFDVHITIDRPGQGEIRRILARYLRPYSVPRAALEVVATGFDTATPALIRQFCEGLKRAVILGPKMGHNMQKEAVVDRLIQSVKPHPDLGLPSLWSLGAKHHAVRALPWPLSTDAIEADADEQPTIEPNRNVVKLGGAKR